jgi:uncharacterized protein YraI
MKKNYIALLIIVLLFNIRFIHAHEPVQAIVIPDHLNLRAEPNGEIIGQLIRGTVVTIVGRDDFRPEAVWVYVISDDLEGWVLSYYLQTPAGEHQNLLPILTDYMLLDEPVQAQGVIIAHWNYPRNYTLRVRSEPDRQSELLYEIPDNTLMVIHGQASELDPRDLSDRWFYVTGIDQEFAGWVFDTYGLYLPEHYPDETIPELQPISNPPLTGFSLEPTVSLQGTIIEDAPLRFGPTDRHPFIHKLPIGASVTLIGRNANSRYVKVISEFGEAWVLTRRMNIEGDFNRLPILTLIGSPEENRWVL